MLGRALSLATLTLLIGCFTAGVARAQENLDAGKSPAQMFSSTCSACHKSPRGLLKTTSASALPGFLRQHYTTGTEMARVLAGYLISNGAADPRYQSREQPRQARQDGRLEPQTDRFGRRQPQAAPAQEAARPDAEAVPGLRDGRRQGRDARRYARPQDATRPEDGQAPAATDSRPGSRQKNRRGKRPVEEPAKSEQAPAGDAAKTDTPRDTSGKSEPAGSAAATPEKADTRREEPAKPAAESVKPTEPGADSRADSARVAPPKENGAGESNQSAPSSAASEPPAASPTPVPAAPPATESK